MKIIITENQLKTIINEGSNTITSDGISKGVDMVKKLMSKLGIEAEDAAAIAGNMWHESHFNPAALHGDTGRTKLTNPQKERDVMKKAYGLIQWTDPRRGKLKNKSEEENKNPADLNLQLDFLRYELLENDYYSPLFDIVKSKSTVKDKAETFSKLIEGSGATVHTNRIDAAEKIYDEYLKTKKSESEKPKRNTTYQPTDYVEPASTTYVHNPYKIKK